MTTSFPVAGRPSSGIFVERLARALAESAQVDVLTPCAAEREPRSVQRPYRLACVRYAPWRWQVLAHRPGGIPAALREGRSRYLLLASLMVAMAWACLRLARRSDVLHANWSVNGVLAGIAGRVLGCPVVTTLRGQDVNRAGRAGVLSVTLSLALRLSHRIAAVSESIAADIRAREPRYAAKVRVIGNGVGQSFLEIGAARRYGDGGVLRFLSVGSLLPAKGVHELLAAVAELSGRCRLELRVAGDGPDRARLERIAHGLRDRCNVQFAGNVEPDRMPEEFARADLFVLTSHAEGRPNALLEAMAAGLPVVATGLPGVRELVAHGESALLYEAGDVRDLKAQLTRACQDSGLRARLGRNAHARIQAMGLTWEACAGRYLDLYAELLPRGLSGG